MHAYARFCYRLFRWIDESYGEKIQSILYKADIQMPPGMYVGYIIVTSLISTSAVAVGSFVYFKYIYKSEIWLQLVVLLSILTFLGSLAALPFITLNKISSRKIDIEKNLPLVMAYMAMLASTGMNPVNVIKHVSLKDFGAVSREFRKIVYRFEVLGEDVISAINCVANRTPSPIFSDILVGIANIIFSGGSLKDYCEEKSRELFEIKRARLREFIDSLAIFAEGYLGGILISVIMGVIGIIVVGALGIKMSFLSTQSLFDLLVYFIVPFINVLFLAMIELKFSGGYV